MPRVISSSHKFRACFISSPPLVVLPTSSPPLTSSSSFHFISFYSILSHLILYRARARIRPRHDVRMSEVNDVFSFPCLFFFFSFFARRFYLAVLERDGTSNGRGRKEKTRWGTLGFIPVVNNIFIAASSGGKTWGAKVQFRKMFAVSMHADRAAPRCNAFVSN